MKTKTVKKTNTKIGYWNDHLDKKYGKPGMAARTEFESRAQAFVTGELLKKERTSAKLTQEAPATKTGTKKSYILRVENGRIDI